MFDLLQLIDFSYEDSIHRATMYFFCVNFSIFVSALLNVLIISVFLLFAMRDDLQYVFVEDASVLWLAAVLDRDVTLIASLLVSHAV